MTWAQKARTYVRIHESRSRCKREWKDISGDTWCTCDESSSSATTRYYPRSCIGNSDQTHPHFSPIPLYVVSPQNSECCEAQSILIVVFTQKKECLVLLCKYERPFWTFKPLVWGCEPLQVMHVAVNFPKRDTYCTSLHPKNSLDTP
jgi:hypothetical protein